MVKDVLVFEEGERASEWPHATGFDAAAKHGSGAEMQKLNIKKAGGQSQTNAPAGTNEMQATELSVISLQSLLHHVTLVVANRRIACPLPLEDVGRTGTSELHPITCSEAEGAALLQLDRTTTVIGEVEMWLRRRAFAEKLAFSLDGIGEQPNGTASQHDNRQTHRQTRTQGQTNEGECKTGKCLANHRSSNSRKKLGLS